MDHVAKRQRDGSASHTKKTGMGLQSLTSTAVAFLRSNLGCRITLRDLEEQTGSNSFRIIRAFQRDLGTTPHAFLIELRVTRATELLLQGEPAAEIASEVGFVDQSHLTRHFKRHVGTTPAAYARSARRAASST